MAAMGMPDAGASPGLIRRAALACGVAALVVLASAAGAQTTRPAADASARQVFEAELPAFRRAAPDAVLDHLRRRVTSLLAPLPGFDPGSRAVDLVVERPWPTLRGRCRAPRGALAAEEAFALVDDMLRETGLAGRTGAAERGRLAAMLASLDGRLCRCAHQPSLALAADCAS
jgi:hypothetical protein